MSLKQVDSLIRFSEQVKSLRDYKAACDSLLVIERAKFLNEQQTRRKEMENYKNIIEGFAHIERTLNSEVFVLKKRYKQKERTVRFWKILTGAAVAGIGYTLIKK